jgi:hypothetical protein
MEIKAKITPTFIEIKVDEIETTIFKSDKSEAENMIYNLLDIAYFLSAYTGKSVKEYAIEFGYE